MSKRKPDAVQQPPSGGFFVVNVDRGIEVDGTHYPLYAEFEHAGSQHVAQLVESGFLLRKINEANPEKE
jgi:hypothetical protein